MIMSCSDIPSNISDDLDQPDLSEQKLDFLGITNKHKLSAASKRALQWSNDQLYNNDWYFEYSVYDLKGDFAYQEGVVRRDPSAIIKHQGKYYTWYTKSIGKTDGFDGDINKDKVFPWDSYRRLQKRWETI